MAHVLKFVDDVDSAATVRLDLNASNGVLRVREVQWNPARLLRAVSQNVLRDGGYVGPSSYDLRSLGVSLFLVAADFDEAADYIQDLARELDRPTNWLMYQPDGATNPVFFKTYRSDISALQELLVTPRPLQQIDVELLTDPHAYGERQTVSVGTVNNDPAAGSNGCYFDVSSVKGDVETPVVLVETPAAATGRAIRMLARRTSEGSATLPIVYQAESLSLSTDTTNPGGGPDSVMSGSGTNNYVTTSFATSTVLSTRLELLETTNATQDALAGTFRVMAVVRRSSATGVINVATTWGVNLTQNASVATAATTSRQVVDLGLVTFGSPSPALHPYVYVRLQADRESGTATLDWDCVMFMPADEQLLISQISSADGSSSHVVIDGENSDVYSTSGADIYGTGADLVTLGAASSGGFPALRPGFTNRFLLFRYAATGAIVKADTSTITAYYLPRYTMIRTATT